LFTILDWKDQSQDSANHGVEDIHEQHGCRYSAVAVPNLVDVVLGSHLVEDDPKMVDEIHGLNGRHLGHNDREIVDDDKRHRRFDKQLRLHNDARLQTISHRPVKTKPTTNKDLK